MHSVSLTSYFGRSVSGCEFVLDARVTACTLTISTSHSAVSKTILLYIPVVVKFTCWSREWKLTTRVGSPSIVLSPNHRHFLVLTDLMVQFIYPSYDTPSTFGIAPSSSFSKCNQCHIRAHAAITAAITTTSTGCRERACGDQARVDDKRVSYVFLGRAERTRGATGKQQPGQERWARANKHFVLSTAVYLVTSQCLRFAPASARESSCGCLSC